MTISSFIAGSAKVMLIVEEHLKKAATKIMNKAKDPCISKGALQVPVERVSYLTYIMGIIAAPILFALEEFPQLHAVIDQGFDNPANIDTALEYLWKNQGIETTRELAEKHSRLAAAAIDALPDSNNEDVRNSRQALVILTQRIIRKG